MLDMTLAEFETANETSFFSMLKYYGESTTVDALDAKVDVNFEGVFRLASVKADLNVPFIISVNADNVVVNDGLPDVVDEFNVMTAINNRPKPGGAECAPRALFYILIRLKYIKKYIFLKYLCTNPKLCAIIYR